MLFSITLSMVNFINEIAKMTGLPFDVLRDGYRLVNFGGRAVYFEGIKGIINISEQRISLRVGKRIAEILGEELFIKVLSQHDCVILGKIKAVEVN